MKEPEPNRVVVLCGPQLRHRHTCATLIDASVNVVGICICDQKTGRIPVRYVWRSLRRRGLLQTLGQVSGRLYYSLLNRGKDATVFRRL